MPIKKPSICFNCESSHNALLYHAYDFDTGKISYSLTRCQDCHLIYTESITDKVLSAAYCKNYYGSSNSKFFGVIEALISFGHKKQAKKILALHSRKCEKNAPLKVLDIGCGRALLLQEFQKTGAHCTGIERNEYPASDNNIEYFVGSLSDPELTDRTFDIIIIWHVLEHITELGGLLKELGKHLEHDGLLVISVPSFSSWQSRFFKQYWFHLDLPRHVSHFTSCWLNNTLTKQGLSIIQQSSFTPSQNIYSFIQSTLNKVFPHHSNRLYKLLIQRQDWKDCLALVFWSALATMILPIAIIETLISEKSLQGATITFYIGHKSTD
jgi:ubiquinone/menaquinone biosynthesis C-methylase UbiE